MKITSFADLEKHIGKLITVNNMGYIDRGYVFLPGKPRRINGRLDKKCGSYFLALSNGYMNIYRDSFSRLDAEAMEEK